MWEVIIFTFTIAICIISFIIIFNCIKKLSVYWKIGALLLSVIIEIPIILYIFDSYNIAYAMHLYMVIPLERWIPFVYNCAGIIMGGSFSGLIVVMATALQIKSQEIENDESKRINNLPLLEYRIEIYDDYNVSPYVDLCKQKKKFTPVFVGIYLRNIGMNTVRKYYINCKTNDVFDEYDYKIDDQTLIKKDSEKRLVFKVPVYGDNVILSFKIKYQDILLNWYEQEVFVKIDNIKIVDSYYDDARITANITNDVHDEINVGKNIDLNIAK